jgi:hypothetical protein
MVMESLTGYLSVERITVNSSWKSLYEKIDGRAVGKVSPQKFPKRAKFPHDMNACPQLDTCHIGSYFGPLVPNFRT